MRRSIVSVLRRLLPFMIQHGFKQHRSNALSLATLMNIEVEHASCVDLLHASRVAHCRYKKLLVAWFEESECFAPVYHYVNRLVRWSLEKLLLGCNNAAQALRLRRFFTHLVEYLAEWAKRLINVAHVGVVDDKNVCLSRTPLALVKSCLTRKIEVHCRFLLGKK